MYGFLIERNVPMRSTRALIKPAKFMFGDWISRPELISNKVYRLCRARHVTRRIYVEFYVSNEQI